MSANIAKFFRSMPCDLLKEYFVKYPSTVSKAVNWNEPPKNVAAPLLKAVDDLSDEEMALLNSNAERINEMTDEIGPTALRSVIPEEDFDEYRNLQNAHQRSSYIFLRHHDAFRRAEEIRYTDHYRKSRIWGGFIGPKDIYVSRAPLDIENFKQRIIEYFRIDGKIKIEIFDRKKPYSEDQELNIIQVMVYREGFPESYTALENDDLVAKTFRAVIEMALTYEPVSGQIEVIADTKEIREEVAKAFSVTLLQTEIEGETVPLKQYDISKLLRQFDFPTDPDDGIASVKVTMLKLKPQDNSNKVTLEVAARETRTIYEVSQEWFNTHDPLRNGFYLSQVKLAIYFTPDEENRRGKVVPVKIIWPNGCDLKDKTEKERLIGDKYLKRWGLLRKA